MFDRRKVLTGSILETLGQTALLIDFGFIAHAFIDQAKYPVEVYCCSSAVAVIGLVAVLAGKRIALGTLK
jgi:hypothetical protein